MKAILLEQYGGAEQLRFGSAPTPVPRGDQVLIKLRYAGINYIDIYFRNGLYPVPGLPAILGKEGLGEVVAVGPDAKIFRVGDVVAYPFSEHGSYCEYVVAGEQKVIQVPEDLTPKEVLAIMLQGLTAHYLLFSVFAVAPEHTVLIHAAAGGVGLLLVQMAALKGARVIATVSTSEKKELVTNHGADEVIIYDDYKFSERIKALTNGTGVDVVYDSVAKATFEESLMSLKPRGLLALFGNSSGAVPPFDLNRLNPAGSLFVTRPTLGHYIQDRSEFIERMSYLFTLLRKKLIRVTLGGIYPLEDVSRAHEDLENRRTCGKLLLKL